MKNMKIFIAAPLFTLLVILPLFLGRYHMYVVNLVGISILLALGLTLLTGFTGQISIGHAAFFGIGAYTSALLTMKVMIPFWLSFPLGGVAASLISLGIGLPALRISGYYLTLATLSFGQIIQLVLIHWDGLTNGPRGMIVSRPTLGGITFSNDGTYYYIILVVTVAFACFAWNLVRSRIGRAFISIRDSPIASASLGVSLTKYKVVAFVISSFYAGIAGGLYGPLVKFIDPMGFGLAQSSLYVMMIVLGGMATIPGAIIGAFVLTVLPEVLRGFTEYRELVYGIALLVCLLFMPKGFYGLIKYLIRSFNWRKILRLSEKPISRQETI